jgi:hypothetical protein
VINPQAYTPTVWQDGVTPVNAVNLNKLEQGLAAAVGIPADVVVSPATALLIRNRLNGADTQPAFRLGADGKHEFGAGGATAPDVNLYRSSAGYLTTDGAIIAKGANNGLIYSPVAAGGLSLMGQVQGEAQPRFYIDYGGFHRWGDGVAAPDTNLYRHSANTLRTDGFFVAVADVYSHFGITDEQIALTGGGGKAQIAFGTAFDTNLYRSSAGFLATDGSLLIKGTGIYFGAAGDTNLYRSSAGVLATDGALRAKGDLAANMATVNQVWIGHDGSALAPRIQLGNAFDCSLWRAYATMLQTNADMTVEGFMSVGKSRGAGYGIVIGDNTTAGFRTFLDNTGGIGFGDGSGYSADTKLYRAGAGALKTDGQLQVVGTFYCFSDIIAGNGTPGEIWLAGNAGQPAIYFHNSHDTYLYRPTALNLQTNARFRAAGGFEFGDGTVQTTAAGGASTPGTKTLISEQILVANSGSNGVISTAIPAGYREIEITIEAVSTGPTNGDILIYTFDPTPSPGGNMFGGAAGNGDGSGYAANMGPVTIGRSMYHGVFGSPPDYIFFCKIEIQPGYDAARRHAMFYRTISHKDVAGNSGDVNMLNGGVQWPIASPFSAMTGFNLKCQGGQGFGIGSRILVYGTK